MRTVNRGALVSAILVSLVVVAAGPVMGELRSVLRSALAGSFALVVGGTVVVALVGLVAAAVTRIRDQHFWRYLVLACAVVVGGICARGLRTGNADVDAVEAFHLVEYGCLAVLFYLAWWPLEDGAALVLPMLSAIVVASADEWFQWFVPMRVGEVRDVLLDVVASCCGLSMAIAAHPLPRLTLALRTGSARRVVAGWAAATVVFGGFFSTVHLGYEVQDGLGSTFRSHYTREGLEAADRDRSERWRRAPPLVQRRVSREDQYLSEALWHVERRNRAWAAGDDFAAWRENLILESFYAPVLDHPSYAGPSGLRWPPEQRTQAARRTVRMMGPYESDAEPYAIYTWPTWIVWAVLMGAGGLLLLVLTTRREDVES
jgi:hypothetical protein